MLARLIYGLLTILLLTLFLANAGCGVARANCNLGSQICDSLLGKDAQEAFDRLDNMQESVEQIQKEILSLSTQLNFMITNIEADSQQLTALESVLNTLQNAAEANNTVIYEVTMAIAQIESRIEYNDTRIASMFMDIVALQERGDDVLEYILPCGDRYSAFDEVLVKTSSGKLLAYFESGGKRFLTLLEPGQYSTTDGGNCKFTVNSNNQIVNAYR